MKLIFPMPPNIANARMHWRTKLKAKQEYWNKCDWMVTAAARIPAVHIYISSVMYLGNPMDDDNAMNRHKWILDWLKSRGYITDDRKKCITWKSLPEQRIDRKNQRIEIELTAHTGEAA